VRSRLTKLPLPSASGRAEYNCLESQGRKTITKEELVAAIATTTLTSKKQSGEVLNLLLEAIIELVASGEKVTLKEFGTFEQRLRAERIGYSPQTGDRIVIPAAIVPVFVPAREFRRRVTEGIGTESDASHAQVPMQVG
jgi:DNA-binding protein HU-beta